METLGAEGCAHAVDADDDESELGERLQVAVRGGEAAGAAGAGLRAGIDMVDDGVLLFRREVGWAEEQAVDVGFVVAGFHHNLHRRNPAAGLQLRNILACDIDDGLPGGVAHHRNLGLRGRGVGIHEEAVVGRRA